MRHSAGPTPHIGPMVHVHLGLAGQLGWLGFQAQLLVPPLLLPTPPPGLGTWPLVPRRRLTRFWPLLGAQYVAEAEEKLQRARLLVESVRKEKVDLSNQLEEERRCALPLPAPGARF